MANSHKITILAIHRTNFGAVLLRQPVKQKPENETRLTELNRLWICTMKNGAFPVQLKNQYSTSPNVSLCLVVFAI